MSKRAKILLKLNGCLLWILIILFIITMSRKAYDYGYDKGSHLWDDFYEKELGKCTNK